MWIKVKAAGFNTPPVLINTDNITYIEQGSYLGTKVHFKNEQRNGYVEVRIPLKDFEELLTGDRLTKLIKFGVDE